MTVRQYRAICHESIITCKACYGHVHSRYCLGSCKKTTAATEDTRRHHHCCLPSVVSPIEAMRTRSPLNSMSLSSVKLKRHANKNNSFVSLVLQHWKQSIKHSFKDHRILTTENAHNTHVILICNIVTATNFSLHYN